MHLQGTIVHGMALRSPRSVWGSRGRQNFLYRGDSAPRGFYQRNPTRPALLPASSRTKTISPNFQGQENPGVIKADEIYKEVLEMTSSWNKEGISLAEKTVIKDRLRYLNGRSEWISNEVQRNYVMEPIDKLWQQIIHSE